MRVRIIRRPDLASSQVQLVVERWCAGQWETMRWFLLNESEQAHEFAMKLSMTKRIPVEMAVFEDGEKLPRACKHPMGFPCQCGAMAKSEDIVDRMLRENAAANAALPDYEEDKS